MTAIAILLTLALFGQINADIVELKCSDNATCIDNLTKEFVRSIRQQKTVRLFDVLTIEPIRTRQARSSRSLLSNLLDGHAFSFDWDDFTFKLTKPEDKDDELDLEMYESRTVLTKDVSDKASKTSKSKAEDDSKEEEEGSSKPAAAKLPKLGLHGLHGHRIRRRHKKKVLQAVVPLLFGMKSAGAVMLGMAVVTVLTLKAFVASKTALLVSLGLAAKKLYDTYGHKIPETSYVLWNVARYFRLLFGLPDVPPLSHEPSMPLPMYVMPQVMPQMMNQMYNPASMGVPGVA